VSLLQVVRHYADALYQIAEETNAVPAVQKDMDTLAKTLREIPEVLAWCQKGNAHPGSGERFVEAAFVPLVGRLTGNTLRLVARHDRLAAIPFFPQAFQAVVDKNTRTVRVTLETVQEPDQTLVDEVRAAMASRTGRQVALVHRVDPELVAGFRVLWDDRMLDLTARARLRNLKTQLTSE